MSGDKCVLVPVQGFVTPARREVGWGLWGAGTGPVTARAVSVGTSLLYERASPSGLWSEGAGWPVYVSIRGTTLLCEASAVFTVNGSEPAAGAEQAKVDVKQLVIMLFLPSPPSRCGRGNELNVRWRGHGVVVVYLGEE